MVAMGAPVSVDRLWPRPPATSTLHALACSARHDMLFGEPGKSGLVALNLDFDQVKKFIKERLGIEAHRKIGDFIKGVFAVFQGGEIEIILGKSDKFDELMVAAAAERREVEDEEQA
ncbi:Serine--tRNA ligase cytoplasmic [Zea mays]|uniref:Serine--tRNA ligase cytoplasmic n=1 Tax=Zea mays TaxID=4577 RepID=A0A1D6F5Q5_MAIZE|nr:Serine--tRNA ligase cytoplasmic [Zea mays]ONM26619.1 Serine--tRNA ligase cytoplasmic [Zea mays]